MKNEIFGLTFWDATHGISVAMFVGKTSKNEVDKDSPKAKDC